MRQRGDEVEHLFTPGPIAAPILRAIIEKSMVDPMPPLEIIQKETKVKAKDRRQMQRESLPDQFDAKKEEIHEREERQKERDIQRKRRRREKEFIEEDFKP